MLLNFSSADRAEKVEEWAKGEIDLAANHICFYGGWAKVLQKSASKESGKVFTKS
jgi:hypothetical protein